jgi:hypothetical protein
LLGCGKKKGRGEMLAISNEEFAISNERSEEEEEREGLAQ